MTLKVLFIAREKNNNTPGSVVLNQANSIKKNNIEISFFLIQKGGFFGYLNAIIKLLRTKTDQYDIIHAHYGLCGIIASLSFKRKLVVSLMGSDILSSSKYSLRTYRFLSNNKWYQTIVKTTEMGNVLNAKKYRIIPNGVDTGLFKPIDYFEAKKRLNLPFKVSYVLFVGDPRRIEKNYTLAKKVTDKLKSNNITLLVAHGISTDEMPYYYNVSHCLLVTSHYEGSMNAIKEAMACNIPILSTDVGDARQNIEGLEFNEIIPTDIDVIATKIKLLCKNLSRNQARERIFEKKLDAESVSNEIIELYKNVG